MSNEQCNEINKDLYEFKIYFKNFIKKTISCEDKMYTIQILIEVYVLRIIASLFSDKFILYVILNIIILYAPFEKKCPKFLFKLRMTFKQIIEGVIGLLDCLIPKYEDPNEKKN